MFASPATRGLLAASALVWALAGAPDAAAWSWPADGPVLRAFAALDAAGQAKLERDLLDLLASSNTSQDETVRIPSEYLEVVVLRR